MGRGGGGRFWSRKASYMLYAISIIYKHMAPHIVILLLRRIIADYFSFSTADLGDVMLDMHFDSAVDASSATKFVFS